MAALSVAIERAKVSEFSREEGAARNIVAFEIWCGSKATKVCPSSPDVVAAFVDQQSFQGERFILETLKAIELLHDHFNFANPVATARVRDAVAKIVKVDPPRAWSRAEKELFRTVSPSVQAIIAKREKDRDREVRRLQNERAEERKRLAASEPQPAEQQKDEVQHADSI